MKHSSKTRTFRACLVALLVSPVSASAQPSPVDEHLRRGVELRRAHRDDEALAEFEAAYELSREPRTAAQLGLARQAIGRWLDAERLLREALAARSDSWVARNAASLEGALAVVERHIGRIEVRGDVPGAELRIDGELVATLPMREPARVLAGVVSLEVRAGGYETVSRRFVVDPGALVRESVEMRATASVAIAPTVVAPLAVVPPVVAQTPRPSITAPSNTSPRRTWGLVALASGGAALVLGGVAIGLREDGAQRYNEPGRCPPPPAPAASACGDLAGGVSVWQTTAWIALPVGAALSLTGALLYLLPGRRGARGVALRCSPAITGPGVICGGSF